MPKLSCSSAPGLVSTTSHTAVALPFASTESSVTGTPLAVVVVGVAAGMPPMTLPDGKLESDWVADPGPACPLPNGLLFGETRVFHAVVKFSEYCSVAIATGGAPWLWHCENPAPALFRFPVFAGFLNATVMPGWTIPTVRVGLL